MMTVYPAIFIVFVCNSIALRSGTFHMVRRLVVIAVEVLFSVTLAPTLERPLSDEGSYIYGSKLLVATPKVVLAFWAPW